MVCQFEFLVIGSGISGLSYALKVANKGTVALLCKTTLEESNTFYAQGGIASVSLSSDTFEKHINDTLTAGDGLCNRRVVEQVVRKAPDQIKELIYHGVHFDTYANGNFSLHKEGGHSESRILHHKDKTGEEIQKRLIQAVKNHQNIVTFDNHFTIELLTQYNLGVKVSKSMKSIECYGAYVLNEKTNEIITFLSKVTVICTGGIGSVYKTTTNPDIATGDGISMAYRAHCKIKDMEFVQFHPTALYNPGASPSFLISEALRGYGGILRTKNGQELMTNYDCRGSLAPRDIVARAIYHEMKNSGSDFVYLDITHKSSEETKISYPTIYERCLKEGIDITKSYIPVSPAAHYICGGILVDEYGRTSIRRLYALGECSCTGLHGANRLASNSLIEAIVYADIVADHSTIYSGKYTFNQKVPIWEYKSISLTQNALKLIAYNTKEVRSLMNNYAGVIRSNKRLNYAIERLKLIYNEVEDLYLHFNVSRRLCELRNSVCVGYLIISQAIERKESLGLHYTVDYPSKNNFNL